jgi:threonine dehydrogenase-like Zn-dependent dehydrogenase
LLGLPPHGAEVAIVPDDFVNNDITLQGSFSYTREAWSDVVALLNAGDLNPSFLVTHTFGLLDFERAIETLRHAPSGVARGKIMVTLSN